jgi:hypothetical protein
VRAARAGPPGSTNPQQPQYQPSPSRPSGAPQRGQRASGARAVVPAAVWWGAVTRGIMPRRTTPPQGGRERHAGRASLGRRSGAAAEAAPEPAATAVAARPAVTPVGAHAALLAALGDALLHRRDVAVEGGPLRAGEHRAQVGDLTLVQLLHPAAHLLTLGAQQGARRAVWTLTAGGAAGALPLRALGAGAARGLHELAALLGITLLDLAHAGLLLLAQRDVAEERACADAARLAVLPVTVPGTVPVTLAGALLGAAAGRLVGRTGRYLRDDGGADRERGAQGQGTKGEGTHRYCS